ncbi:hypothetical protein HPB50_002123 [Hyalomma asiaticum]|uniref:Uncharacterized protein n=1 Tax=Hyalomma asiaticum TaxID=266040 RepID=A0ACB7TFK7_HYAAI|nr:hypothetical protein HPB50_002123 [Hyalomma asiaticum]
MVSSDDTSPSRGSPCAVPSDFGDEPVQSRAPFDANVTIRVNDDKECRPQITRPPILNVSVAEEGKASFTLCLSIAYKACFAFGDTSQPTKNSREGKDMKEPGRASGSRIPKHGPRERPARRPNGRRPRPVLGPVPADVELARAFRSDWPFLSVVALIATAIVIFLMVVYLKEDTGVRELMPKLAMKMLEREGLLISRERSCCWHEDVAPADRPQPDEVPQPDPVA